MELQIDVSKLTWNITTDLETGQIEAADTDYYLYVSDQGQEVLSNIKPHNRSDLKGQYHPYHSWRCIGVAHNDSSNDLVVVNDVPYLSEKNERTVYLKDLKQADGGSALATTVNIRDLNTVEGDSKLVDLDSNQFILAPGKYKGYGRSLAQEVQYHQLYLYNVTDSKYELFSDSNYTSNISNIHGSVEFEGSFTIDKSKVFELRHYTFAARATTGWGFRMDNLANVPDTDTRFSTVKLTTHKN